MTPTKGKCKRLCFVKPTFLLASGFDVSPIKKLGYLVKGSPIDNHTSLQVHNYVCWEEFLVAANDHQFGRQEAA